MYDELKLLYKQKEHTREKLECIRKGLGEEGKGEKISIREAGEVMCNDLKELGQYMDVIDTCIYLRTLETSQGHAFQQMFGRTYGMSLGFHVYEDHIDFVTIWHKGDPSYEDDDTPHLRFSSFGDIPEEDLSHPSVFLKTMLRIALEWDRLLPGVIENMEYLLLSEMGRMQEEIMYEIMADTIGNENIKRKK